MQGDYKLKLTTAAHEDVWSRPVHGIFAEISDLLTGLISPGGYVCNVLKCNVSFAGAVE